LNRTLSTAKKAGNNHAEYDQYEYRVYDREACSAQRGVMKPFPNIQDRKENHDYAPEPLLLLRPSLKAGIDEWHLEGL